jgi:hypothetical protein
MDTNEAGGFFPEREVLRARRLRAMVDQPGEPVEARTRQTGMWMVWVTVFFPMIVNAITMGWNERITPGSIAVIKYSPWLLLAACGGVVAVGIWRTFNKVHD